MIDEAEGDVIGLLQALVGLQHDGEEAVQSLVIQRLSAAGADVEALRYEPRDVPLVDEFAAGAADARGERRSIVGRFDGQAAEGRSLIIFAHPDSEPTASARHWSRPPFSASIHDGRVYGWGIADDLAGVATGIAAMEMIARAGIRLAGDVIFASTPSKNNARGVAAVLHQGYDADAALYLHPAESGVGMHEIKALTSGQLEFAITVSGMPPETHEPGQTAFSHLGVNPLDKALALIWALKALDAERATRVTHRLLDAAVGRSTNLMISSIDFGGTAPLWRMPETLTFSGAISFPPGEKLEAVQKEVEAALHAAIAADPFLTENPPRLDWLSGVTGIEVAATHPLYQTLSDAIAEVCGFEPEVNPMHTSSDIRNPIVQKGIPTLGFGPLCGDLTHAGGIDEWVDREDYLRAVKVTAASIIGWCGVVQ
ncbi:M20/M25/M40 family metallo-hydrolase [Arsenicitalea aurantiaca]|uniref:M20/M25/M40 family metallo-hydrolase n=1 Tax=Arsenicitalea aurantiaca TaxID=1783274 RepID=A0A433XEB5_9HYPH|nr:M20/M25/M40 family metallo-hydrolase [Arsenicitalea aurantiaca]RUT32461.1 M20/M25/M40 family metallo-hydrolase [Arsenicitalea aurantiaca]